MRKNARSSPGPGSRTCSMPFAPPRIQSPSEGSDQAISATRSARSSSAKSALARLRRMMMPKWLCMSAIGTRDSALAAERCRRASVDSAAERRTRRVRPSFIAALCAMLNHVDTSARPQEQVEDRGDDDIGADGRLSPTSLLGGAFGQKRISPRVRYRWL